MDPKYLFVGKDLELHEGEDARKLLANINDVQFFESGQGVVRVPKSRWQLAQEYERHTWMDACSHAVDDRNDEHADGFDEYASLRGSVFPRAIELGCGPFTNIRVIAKYAEIKSTVLLDPLIDSYISHRNCMYVNGKIKVSESKLSVTLGRSWPGRAVRRLIRAIAPDSLIKGVPLERRIASSIEEMPDCGTFDLVIMINVIEHCFDVQTIFKKILGLGKPGSIFVFHDRLFDAVEVAEDVKTRFDAGHPLRVSGPLVIKFLEENFLPLMQREVDIVDIVGEFDLTERGIYFIGKRR